MSDESLFSKHIALITKPESTWTAEQRAEWDKINSLELPPLRLPKKEKKISIWENWRQQWKYGFSILAVVSLALIVIIPQLRDTEDTLTAKGSTRVSVYWERDNKVSPLTDTSVLLDGDKIGANVVSSEDSVAYWMITDKDLHVLDDVKDIEASRLKLTAGVTERFESSFQLVAPNQGENLIVVVCPNPTKDNTVIENKLIMDRGFLSDVLEKQNKKANDCLYAGFRLRKAP